MTNSHVFDTYAKTSKGRIMHFNVVLDENNQEKALNYAKHWLARIGEAQAILDANNCYLCHSGEAPAEIRKQIAVHGYAIFKLEGCPK